MIHAHRMSPVDVTGSQLYHVFRLINQVSFQLCLLKSVNTHSHLLLIAWMFHFLICNVDQRFGVHSYDAPYGSVFLLRKICS